MAISEGIVFMRKCEESIEQLNKNDDGDDDDDKATSSTSGGYHNMIKPEKMKLPTFGGNIRTFAKFKKDFGNPKFFKS